MRVEENVKKSTGPQTGLDNFFQKQARSILESPWEIVQVFHIFNVIVCLFTNFNLLSANLTKWFDHRQKPTNSLLKPSSPENNRKPLVSLYFHGDQKGILGKNGLAHLLQTLIEYFRDKKTDPDFFHYTSQCTWTQDANWTYMYIRRLKDVLDIFWMSYVRSIYVLCPGGK